MLPWRPEVTMAERFCMDCVFYVDKVWACIHPSSRTTASVNPVIGVPTEYDRFPHPAGARAQGWPCGAKGKLWAPTAVYLARATKMAIEEKNLPYDRTVRVEDDADNGLAEGTADAEAITDVSV